MTDLHPVVQAVLDMGYRESIGPSAVSASFAAFCGAQQVPPSVLARADDATVNAFIGFLLEDGGLDDEEASSDDGEGAGAPAEAWDDGFVDGEVIDVGSSSDDDDDGGAAARRIVISDDDDDDISDDSNGGGGTRVALRPVATNATTSAPRGVKRANSLTLSRAPPPLTAAPPLAPPSTTLATSEDRALAPIDLALRRVFGLAAFRTSQRDVVDAVLAGRDVFVLMPTGGGKSLCYKLPAVVSVGLTVVVSPLLSLVQDQVAALLSAPCGGIPAASLSSALPEATRRSVMRELEAGAPTLKLLYVTPEQLVKSDALTTRLARLADGGRLARLVVDEAHCVSSWGHDFRPDYKQIGAVRAARFPRVPITALTATAPRAVVDDVLKSLHMRDAVTFTVSFFRPNLTLRVLPKPSGRTEDGAPADLAAIAGFLTAPDRAKATGIIYCLSRDDTETMSAFLRDEADVAAAHYHAGVSAGRRAAVQAAWQAGEVRVVVATIAFGMGIDKDCVRFVIHATLSKCLASYFQEAGRAGRDGAPADCVLFYSGRDVVRIKSLLRAPGRGSGAKDRYRRGCDALDRMVAWCADKDACRHAGLLRHFGEGMSGGRCERSCDVCRGEVVELGGIGGGGGPAPKRRAGRAQAAAAAAPPPPPNPAAMFQSAAAVYAEGGGGVARVPRRATAGAVFFKKK